MIILITGPTHTGKTVLMQRLIEQLKIPGTSMDHVKMGLIRGEYTALTPADDGVLTQFMWPLFREMLKTALENGQHLILEGCYVPFSWHRNFTVQELSSIYCVCLTMTDAYIDQSFDVIQSYGNVIEERLDDEIQKDYLKKENKTYREGFEVDGCRVCSIDDDYASSIHSIVEEIIQWAHNQN